MHLRLYLLYVWWEYPKCNSTHYHAQVFASMHPTLDLLMIYSGRYDTCNLRFYLYLFVLNVYMRIDWFLNRDCETI